MTQIQIITMLYNTRKVGCIFNRKQSIVIHSEEDKECEKGQICQVMDLSGQKLQQFPIQAMQSATIAYPNKMSEIKRLILDDNNIFEVTIDHRNIAVGELRMNKNKIHKFTLKQSIATQMQHNLKSLYLGSNLLSFLDVELLNNLQTLHCPHNNLQTLILPTSITNLDASYNQLASIQYSLLSARVHPHLHTLDLSHNRLYDLILGINGHSLLPNLLKIYCQDNSITYMQHLPPNLQQLYLDRNSLIIDRMGVNALLNLHKLSILTIQGNICSREMQQLLRSKLGQTFHIVKQCEDESERQSPYKLYNQLLIPTTNKLKIKQRKNQQHIFTLGDNNSEMDSIVDQQYNFSIQDYPQQQNNDNNYMIENDCNMFRKDDTKLRPRQVNQQPIVQDMGDKQDKLMNKEYDILDNCAKQNVSPANNQKQNKNHSLQQVKNQKQQNINHRFKASSHQQSLRYHNHYKEYLDSLLEFSYVPCRPFRHSERSKTISIRIDGHHGPINQFNLFDEMFRQRGGVHYVRKISRLAPQRVPQKQEQLMFLNRDFTKNDFNKIIDGHYEDIEIQNIQRHQLAPLPSSFTCYHIVIRVEKKNPSKWYSAYIIQTAHL